MKKIFMFSTVLLLALSLLSAQPILPLIPTPRSVQARLEGSVPTSRQVDLYVYMEPGFYLTQHNPGLTQPARPIVVQLETQKQVHTPMERIPTGGRGGEFYWMKLDPGLYQLTIPTTSGSQTHDLCLVPGLSYMIGGVRDSTGISAGRMDLGTFHLDVEENKSPAGLTNALALFKSWGTQELWLLCGSSESLECMVAQLANMHDLNYRETLFQFYRQVYNFGNEPVAIRPAMNFAQDDYGQPPLLIRKAETEELPEVDNRNGKDSRTGQPLTLSRLAKDIFQANITRLHSAILNDNNRLILVYETKN